MSIEEVASHLAPFLPIQTSLPLLLRFPALIYGAGSFASAEFVIHGYGQKMTGNEGCRQFSLAVYEPAPFSEILQGLISRHMLATLGLKSCRQNLMGQMVWGLPLHRLTRSNTSEVLLKLSNIPLSRCPVPEPVSVCSLCRRGPLTSHPEILVTFGKMPRKPSGAMEIINRPSKDEHYNP